MIDEFGKRDDPTPLIQDRKKVIEFMIPGGLGFFTTGRIVMEQQDIAWPYVLKHLCRQVADIPVTAVKNAATEGNGLHSQGGKSRLETGAGDTDGRTKNQRLNPRLGKDILGCPDILFQCLAIPHHEQIVVVRGVVADGMALGKNSRNQLRMGSGIFSDHKEGRRELVLGQQFEQHRGGCGKGTIVKGERNPARPFPPPGDDGEKKRPPGAERRNQTGEQEDDKGHCGGLGDGAAAEERSEEEGGHS